MLKLLMNVQIKKIETLSPCPQVKKTESEDTNNFANTSVALHNDVDTYKVQTQFGEWSLLNKYAPEFLDTYLDIPSEPIDQKYFSLFQTEVQAMQHINDIMLAHKVILSGMPNRYGCRIPVHSNWNLPLMESLLHNYDDKEVLQWLTYGFSIARRDDMEDPEPVHSNHLGANLYPADIDAYF